MINGVFWALELVGIDPIARLTAVHLANSFLWVDGVEDVVAEDAAMESDIKKAAEWIGCEREDVEAAILRLTDFGLRDVSLSGDKVIYRLPRPTSFAQVSPQPERLLSIYVITMGAGVTKIGISRSPTIRLESLRSNNPTSELRLAFQSEGPASLIRRAEREAHSELEFCKLRNEWFATDETSAIGVVRLVLDRLGLIK